jgi:hypothetical protein
MVSRLRIEEIKRMSPEERANCLRSLLEQALEISEGVVEIHDDVFIVWLEGFVSDHNLLVSLQCKPNHRNSSSTRGDHEENPQVL